MISSQYIPYATVAFLCAFGLLHFCQNIRKYAPNTQANRFFRAAIIACAVCAMTEFCFVFHESGLITNLVYCYGTEIIYSFASLVSGFCWFMCSEIEQDAKTVQTHARRVLLSIPIAAMILLDLTTPIHHLLFYFTQDGHYERGIFSTPFVVVTALYIAKSGFCALFNSFRKEHYLKRSQYLTFFYYALAILISQLFQIVLGSVLPFRIIGAVVVFFLVQEKTIKQNVFVDLVTDTNNRTAMDKYLKANFETADAHFALAMIDMDDFKQINDKFGHTAGDKALRLVSSAFKQSMPSRMFFGRFGGDEFVIIGQTETTHDIDSIVEKARQSIAQRCQKENLPYIPTFSHGVAYRTESIKTIPELINNADAAMYETKHKHKAEIR